MTLVWIGLGIAGVTIIALAIGFFFLIGEDMRERK
jgi:hypothetical protein